MGYRIAPRPFITALPVRALYGPGRYCFGHGEHDWWIRANTIDDNPNVPPGYSQVIGTYDSIADAYARLDKWTQSQG